MHATHCTPNCTACLEKDQRIAMLTLDPGFGIAHSQETHYQIRTLPTGQYVQAWLGDIDHLKQLNSACRSQERVNELLRAGFAQIRVRPGDALVWGRYDQGDKVLAVFPVGLGGGATERVSDELQAMPMTNDERRRYVAGVYRKKLGPTLGAVATWLHRAGLLRQPDYPTITWKPIPEGVAAELLDRINAADTAIFDAKDGK